MPDPRRLSLTALLDDYQPVGDEEGRHLRRMRALLEAKRPFSRSFTEPGHFTASCFILSPARDALYLIHHRKLRRWLQPGGHVEEGDLDLLAAARREALEEVGLEDALLADERRPLLDLDVHRIPAFGDEPAHEHFDVRFLFLAPSLSAVRPKSEVAGGRWFPLAELEQQGDDESVRRAAAKLRA